MKKTNLLTTLALPIIMAFGVNTANAQNDVSKVQDGKVSIEAIPTNLDEFKALQAETCRAVFMYAP